MAWRLLACGIVSWLLVERMRCTMFHSGLQTVGRITCTCVGWLVLAVSPPPQPPPPAAPPAYRLDYPRTFFASPAAELADRRTVAAMVDTLSRLLPRVSRSAVALEAALRL